MTVDPAYFVLRALALLGLILLSAFFSGSETALFSLSRTRARRMASGTRGERAAARLLRTPQRILGTCVVGNMIVNVMLASLVASMAHVLFGGKGVAAAILFSTFFLLLLGEVTPKTAAVKFSHRMARSVAMPLTVAGGILAPIRAVVRWATNGLLAVLGQAPMTAWSGITREEIEALLALCEDGGGTTGTERTLVDNILKLSAIEAHDLMVPRTEVLGLEDDLTVGEAFERARVARHSRLPVYHGSLDEIWAIFYVIDMPRCGAITDQRLADLRAGFEGAPAKEFPPLYPAHVFPETAKVEKLLTEMRGRRAAVVTLVDEYGGTAGILTLDDILSEIVGHATPAGRAAKAGVTFADGYMLVDGRTHVRELSQLIDADIPRNAADTVGGYVTERLGHLPRAGDTVEDDRFRFQVIKMVGRRIGTLRVQFRDPDRGQGKVENRRQ